jgi:hypothetical protein
MGGVGGTARHIDLCLRATGHVYWEQAHESPGESHRFYLQVSKVGAHASMTPSTKSDESKLGCLVVAAGRQETLEVIRVGVLEQLFRAVLHAWRRDADVTLGDVELPAL